MPILTTAIPPASRREVDGRRELNEFYNRNGATPAAWRSLRQAAPLSAEKQAQEAREATKALRWGSRAGEQARLESQIATGVRSIKRAYTHVDPWQIAKLAKPVKRDVHRLRILLQAAGNVDLPSRQSQWRNLPTAPQSTTVGAAESTLAWTCDIERWMARNNLPIAPSLQTWGEAIQSEPQLVEQRAEEAKAAKRLRNQGSQEAITGYVQDIVKTLRAAAQSNGASQELGLLEILVRDLRLGLLAKGVAEVSLPTLRAQFRLAGGFSWDNDAAWLSGLRGWLASPESHL